MPRARRRSKGVPPPAVAKKRYEYDVAEPKEAKPKATKTAAGKDKK
jgi:hypothetical protein